MLNKVPKQTHKTQQENNIPAKNLTSEESLNEEETPKCTLNDIAPLEQCSSISIDEVEQTNRKSKENKLRDAFHKKNGENNDIVQIGGRRLSKKINSNSLK